MSHWRKKRNPPTSQFNAHHSCLALVLTALVGALILLSLHQHANERGRQLMGWMAP
jgi:hypothetical protein